MESTITFSTHFDLRVRIRKVDRRRIEFMMIENKYNFSFEESEFIGFCFLIVRKVTIHKAETIRQLIKCKIYDA